MKLGHYTGTASNRCWLFLRAKADSHAVSVDSLDKFCKEPALSLSLLCGDLNREVLLMPCVGFQKVEFDMYPVMFVGEVLLDLT